jgi:hypothetical protein
MVPTPLPIAADTFRDEGVRQGLIGDGLELFVEQLVEIDDCWVEHEMKRLREEAARRR